jgi:transposase-like protein
MRRDAREERIRDEFGNYHESFRLRVVKEVEHGLISKEGARRKYGIGGKTTVLSWCRKYGREEYPHMAGKHQQRYPQRTPDEKDKRIAELEALLKQKELAVDALESLIEVANEMYGTDLKKKVGIRRSVK